MKLSFRWLRALILSALTLAGVTAFFQSLAYLISYGIADSNYFANGAPLPVLSAALGLTVCLIGLAVFCFTSKRPDPQNASSTYELPCKSASLASAIGFLAGAFVLGRAADTVLEYAAVVFLILAAIYSVLAAIRKAPFPKEWIALIGFSAVIGTILIDALFYFDKAMEMNAPVKVTVLIGILCTMLYYTAELRFFLDRPAFKSYLMLCCWVTGMGALTAIPIPFAFLTGKLPLTELNLKYLCGAFVILGTLLNAVCKLCSLLTKGPTAAEPTEQTENPVSTEEEEQTEEIPQSPDSIDPTEINEAENGDK